MTDDINQLQELLVSAIQGVTRHFVTSEGKISDVNEDPCTCDVDIGGATFFDVPIKVLVVDGEANTVRASVIEMPKIGSWCLLGFRDGNLQRPQLIAVDQSTTLFIDTPQVTFHKGELGGLPKVIPLTEKLNNVERLLNDFISRYNLHTHPVVAVGQPTGTNTSQEPGTLTPTTREEIENPSIKQ